MYSTCLFCHSPLGRNDSVEHFPVGRRLAFDARRGRLWVVCRKCERWNLSPLEERWEAIEESERLFRATRLRVSTDHIGLARLREGLELIRIGEPQRPEMAAWRYGDQFGRRRTRRMLMLGGAAIVAGAVVVGGPLAGAFGMGVGYNGLQILNGVRTYYRSRQRIHVPTPEGARQVRPLELGAVKLRAEGQNVALDFKTSTPGPWIFLRTPEFTEHTVRGEAAIRAAAALLPHVNHAGGSATDVARAVDYLEEFPDPVRLFHRAARDLVENERGKVIFSGERAALTDLTTSARLALEMASHEDAERRALEGELKLLEAAWQEAEEVAAIADDLLLPSTINSDLERLKRR